MNAQAEFLTIDLSGLEVPIVYIKGPKDVHRPATAAGQGSKWNALGQGSKWNALAHGLTATKLFPLELAAEVERMTEVFRQQYKPTTPYEETLITTMGRAAAQCEHARKLKIINLQCLMDRAVLCWDEDRRVWIQELGARLAGDPMRVQEALAGTKQGVDWLLENWKGLSDALKANGDAGWTPDQYRLAFDLMGVRPELRDSHLSSTSSRRCGWKT